MRSVPLVLALAGLATCVFLVNAQDSEPVKPSAKMTKVKLAIPKSAAKPKELRKLLVFSATSGYRHRSIDLGKQAFALLGKETGAFEAVVSNDLSNFEKEAISEFDAICFLNTTLEVFRPSVAKFEALSEDEKKVIEVRETRLQENLLNFVKNGGGFVGIHAAADTFYKLPEYGEMLGGYFDGHPWNSKTDVSVVIDPSASGNPILSGVTEDDLKFKEEIYQLKEPYNSADLTMLLRLDTEESDMKVRGIKRKDGDFGVSWTKSYGKGRVFYCSLGHNEHIYWNPSVLKIYLNGIQWTMGDL